MTCERTNEIIEGLTLGEGPGSDEGLDGASDREREAHLSSCGPCRAAADQLREVEGALRAVRAPAGFADRVASRIEAGRASPARAPSRFWTLGRAAAAASLLATLALGAVYVERAGRRLEGLQLEGKAAPPGAGTPRLAQAALGVALELRTPPSITVGDEVEATILLRREGLAAPGAAARDVPAETALEVALEVHASPGLEAFIAGDDAARLLPGDERRLRLVLRGAHAGPASVTVVARPPAALVFETRAARAVQVVPDGRAVAVGVGASLTGPRTQVLARLPLEALRLGAPRTLTLRVVRGALAEAELGLRDLVREPHGCFEQTTAATYPSLMVLTLAREGVGVPPALETRARDAATKGALRLRQFQMPDGGFSIHGDSESVPWLTAYGLQELAHLARAGVEVEAGRVERAAQRLLAFEDGEGGLAGAGDRGTWNHGGASEVAVRAFAAHALAAAGLASATGVVDARITRVVDRVEREAAEAGRTVYELALAAKALHALGRAAPARALAARIEAAATPRGERGVTWSHGATLTLAGARGRAAAVETTALAVQVLFVSGDPALASRGLTGLFALRRADGYGGTQAAVQALEAVRAAGGVGGRPEGTLMAHMGGAQVARVELKGEGGAGLLELTLGPAAQTSAVELTSAERVSADRASADAVRLAVERGVELTFTGEGTARVQVLASGFAPSDLALTGPTGLEGGPDRLTVSVERPASTPEGPQLWTIRVANPTPLAFLAPMVTADLPTGFALEGDGGLGALVGAGLRAHELHDGRLALYLEDLPPGASLALPVRLTAPFPGRFTTGTVLAYAYYDRAETLAFAPTERITVERAPPPEAPADPAFDAEAASMERLVARVAPRPASRSYDGTDYGEKGSGETARASTTRTPAPKKPGATGLADSEITTPLPDDEKAAPRHGRKGTFLVEWNFPKAPIAFDADAFPFGHRDLDRLLTRFLARGLPELATCEAAGDGVWHFRLDPEAALWSDGGQITADEVIGSWERARATLTEKRRPPLMDARLVGLLESAAWRAIDSRTIEVRSAASEAALVEALSCVPFLVGAREGSFDAGAARGIVSGAFSIEESSADRLVLVSRGRLARMCVERAGPQTVGADLTIGVSSAKGTTEGPLLRFEALVGGEDREARALVERALAFCSEVVAGKASLVAPPRGQDVNGKPARRPERDPRPLPPIEIVAACGAVVEVAEVYQSALRAAWRGGAIEIAHLRAPGTLAPGAVRIHLTASYAPPESAAVPLGIRRTPWRPNAAIADELRFDEQGYLRSGSLQFVLEPDATDLGAGTVEQPR